MKIPFVKTLQDVEKLLKIMNRFHGAMVGLSMVVFLAALLMGYSVKLLLACVFAMAVFGGLFLSTNSLRMAVIGIFHQK